MKGGNKKNGQEGQQEKKKDRAMELIQESITEEKNKDKEAIAINLSRLGSV